MNSLTKNAHSLIRRLILKKQTLVLAESCTGGNIAATLTTIHGSSSVIAGSFVTYQETSKINWLGVSKSVLLQKTAVSREVAKSMAQGALVRSSKAAIACSITGHFGPDAPKSLEGVVFICVGVRKKNGASIFKIRKVNLGKFPHAARTTFDAQLRERKQRQTRASLSAIQMVRSLL